MKPLKICCKCHVRINDDPEYFLSEENKLEYYGFYSFRRWSIFEKIYYYCCQKHFKEDSLYDSMCIPLNKK
jgi:hypothetical protein